MARTNGPQSAPAQAQPAASPTPPATELLAGVSGVGPVEALAREIFLRRVVAGACVAKTPGHVAAEAFEMAAAFADYADRRAAE